MAEAALICSRNGWRPPVIYQGMYNAVTRDVQRECVPSCRHFGLRFIAYNPLAGGLLTGKHADLNAIPAAGRFSGEYYRDRYWKREYFAAVGALQETARKSRIPLAAASLRWLLHHSRSDGLILGASKVSTCARTSRPAAKAAAAAVRPGLRRGLGTHEAGMPEVLQRLALDKSRWIFTDPKEASMKPEPSRHGS